MSKCRTCLQECSRYHHLEEYAENNLKILEMLDEIVPQIHIRIPSQFSHLMCGVCVDKLLNGYKFQQLCIDSNKRLHTVLGNDESPAEIEVASDDTFDPLMGENKFKMKQELSDNVKFECEINPEEIAENLKSNDACSSVDEAEERDTDSSNEKLNILRERKLRKSLNISKCKKSKLHCLMQPENNRQSDKLSTPRDTRKLKLKSTVNQRHMRVKKKCEKQTQANLWNQKSEKYGKTDEFLCIKNEIMDFRSPPNVIEEIDVMAPLSEGSMDDYNTHGDWFNNEDDFDSTQTGTLREKPSKKPKHGKNTDFVDTGIGEVEKPSSRNRRNGHYPCEVCGKIFDRPYRLKRHRSVHSLDKPYECEICKCRFTSTSYLKAHKLLHKIKNNEHISTSTEGYKCPDCPRRFEKQASLSAHRQIHTRDALQANYACTICQCIFTNVKSLTEHITNKHPEAEKFKCDQCDKIFVLHAHLVEHLNRHRGNKNLVCVICEKEFGFMNSLKEHMRTHNGESPYLCPQCGKTFRNASNLRQHMERHSGLKKYQCPECPSRFNCRSDLKKHVDTHTSTKSHECDMCGSRFTRSYSLQKHKILHSGKRPFKCGQCNMTFSLLYHLRRHIRTHTGEKPYKCKYCERAYAESGDLNKHLRTHVGENTYMCDKCPMAFKYQLELRQHLSVHYKMIQSQTEPAEEEVGHDTSVKEQTNFKNSFE